QPRASSWAVTHIGGAEAVGTWRETVRLIPASLTLAEFATNPGAYTLLGAFTFTNILPPAASVIRTQQATVPLNGPAGDLRLAVIVDSDNDLREQDETDNAALAVSELQVPATLTLVVPVTAVVENTSAPNLTCLVSSNGELTT